MSNQGRGRGDQGRERGGSDQGKERGAGWGDHVIRQFLIHDQQQMDNPPNSSIAGPSQPQRLWSREVARSLGMSLDNSSNGSQHSSFSDQGSRSHMSQFFETYSDASHPPASIDVSTHPRDIMESRLGLVRDQDGHLDQTSVQQLNTIITSLHEKLEQTINTLRQSSNFNKAEVEFESLQRISGIAIDDKQAKIRHFQNQISESTSAQQKLPRIDESIKKNNNGIQNLNADDSLQLWQHLKSAYEMSTQQLETQKEELGSKILHKDEKSRMEESIRKDEKTGASLKANMEHFQKILLAYEKYYEIIRFEVNNDNITSFDQHLHTRGERLIEVSGVGMNCMIRALLASAGHNMRDPNIEQLVDDARNVAIQEGVTTQGALLNIGDQSGQSIIRYLQRERVLDPQRGVSVQILDSQAQEVRGQEIVVGNDPDLPNYSVFLDVQGIHFYGIGNAEQTPSQDVVPSHVYSGDGRSDRVRSFSQEVESSHSEMTAPREFSIAEIAEGYMALGEHGALPPEVQKDIKDYPFTKEELIHFESFFQEAVKDNRIDNKEKQRLNKIARNQSAAEKERKRQYNQSAAGKERKRQYDQSAVGKELKRQYEQSAAGKERRRQYDQSEAVMARMAAREAMKTDTKVLRMENVHVYEIADLASQPTEQLHQSSDNHSLTPDQQRMQDNAHTVHTEMTGEFSNHRSWLDDIVQGGTNAGVTREERLLREYQELREAFLGRLQEKMRENGNSAL